MDKQISDLARHHLSFRDDINEFVDQWEYLKLIHLPESGQMKLPQYKYFYSKKSKALVEQLYADDIKAYNYKFTQRQW